MKYSKIVAVILLIASMVTGLCACGTSNKQNVSGMGQESNNQQTGDVELQGGEEGTSEETEEVDVAFQKTKLHFGEWEDVGNDPNNIWHTQAALAFDEEYIYYSCEPAHSVDFDWAVYRVRYDGSDNTVLCTGDGKASFLNVYQGALYIAESGTRMVEGENYSKEAFYSIRKFDLTTQEESIIYDTGWNSFHHSYDFSTMLATNNYLIYAIYDNIDEVLSVECIDLETLTWYDLAYRVGLSQVNLSVDNHGVCYIFMEDFGDSSKRLVLRVNMEEKSPQAVVEPKELEVYASYMFAPDGYLCYSDYSNEYYNYLWEEIDEEEKKHWRSKNNIGEVRGEDNLFMHEIKNMRFVAGNNIVLLANANGLTMADEEEGQTKIYVCRDFDVNNLEEVGSVQGISGFWNDELNRFGVWGDSFYIIEDREDGTYINQINSEGELKKTKIAE